MIYVGNQTSCWAATPLAPFDFALTNGFNAFEWFPDKKPNAGWDGNDLDLTQRRAICDKGRLGGIRFSIHARLLPNPLTAASQELWLQDLQLGLDLGAALITVHLELETGLDRFVEGLLPLVQRTAGAGVRLALENTPLHSPEDFNRFFTRLRRQDSVITDHVGMCLDIGHANLCAATRNDYLAFVRRIGVEVPIIHLHLHENWGEADTHLPLFTGPAGKDDSGIRRLLEQLRRRQFNGSIILEQWPQPPSLLTEARDRLLQLLTEGEPQSTRLADSVEQRKEAAEPGGRPETVRGHSMASWQAALVAADKRSRSWREKLDAILGLLAGNNVPLNASQLADVAIYLRFLGSGQIACEEDGRHFRPAHHARIALQIRQRLAELPGSEDQWIVRRIYPWLPSSEQQFRRPEPLTRIRDIAHRNDIPSALKREIKESLQNKLHRCAGPEDLITASRLLERITAPGANLSPPFVAEFRIFHGELKEFFNAQSLEDRLRVLLTQGTAEQSGMIRLFLERKGAESLPQRLELFRTLTELRRSLANHLRSRGGGEAEGLLLVDVGLEDFAFVLLSQLLNQLNMAAQRPVWDLALDLLLLTLANLQLSSVLPEECGAVLSELEAWKMNLDPYDRAQMLRLKSSVDRGRRLAEDFSAWMTELFLERAKKLGRALGVANHAANMFSEAEIRANLVFQLSKLATGVLAAIRLQLGLPPWDAIVAGKTSGLVKLVERLAEVRQVPKEPLILLLGRADGDEEMPLEVAGMVLAHPLPHLSHLAVRARQARVVVAACDEATEFEQARQFVGKVITLEVGQDGVLFKECSRVNAGSETRRSGRSQLPIVRLACAPTCIALHEVSLATGGAKTWGVQRLARLASQSDPGFLVPSSAVLPFGLMELALERSPQLQAQYRQLLDGFQNISADKIASLAGQIRELLLSLPVPNEILESIAGHFRPETRFMVRSSANSEDLDDLAGAGLHDSVANVSLADLSPAISAVWASLWTSRAAASRYQAGIPPDGVHMAVLLQEIIAPDYSFVLHTANPINRNTGEIAMELAVGLGETLVSGHTPGVPYRFIWHKRTGVLAPLAFANFSYGLWPAPAGGVRRDLVNYSQVELSRNARLRQDLASRLAVVGVLIERTFGHPQDIEGVVAANRIFIVQSRAQQGLR